MGIFFYIHVNLTLLIKYICSPKNKCIIFDNKLLPTMSALILRDLPLDVRKYILKLQGEIKAERGVCQYSMPLTIYKIIREHQALKSKK